MKPALIAAVCSLVVSVLITPAASWATTAQEDRRVIADLPVLILPSGGSRDGHCLALEAGTLTVELQRVGDLGGGSYPVTFSLDSFVTAASPLPELSVGEARVTASVSIDKGHYCYSLRHSQEWVNRPESGPKGQVIHLRLIWG